MAPASTLAALPAAFRILVVVSPTPRPRRASSLHRHRSFSPRGAGSGPIAFSYRTARLSSRETRRDRYRRGRRAGNTRRNHATQAPSPDHGGSGATGRAAHETQSAQYCAGARARLIRRDLRCGRPTAIVARRWLGQRSRWLKGWMQTFLVHMRQPQRLFHELGPRGFATFFLVVGGNAFVALVHPIFVVGLCWRIAFGAEGSIYAGLCGVSVVAGYAPSAALAWRGLSFRGAGCCCRGLHGWRRSN